METWKRNENGTVAVYEDGNFIGNYDTLSEYHEEKRREEEQEEKGT